jgi:hypothetical protein
MKIIAQSKVELEHLENKVKTLEMAAKAKEIIVEEFNENNENGLKEKLNSLESEYEFLKNQYDYNQAELKVIVNIFFKKCF